ncbi:MAG TPA: hypothetical protein V6C81_05355 [Planktothrix sp.]|jgi:hypothetical protein
MKYLHSGYVLFCEHAEHEENGRIDAKGLFDLFVGKELPMKMNCYVVIGFGTPYERRQYKGIVTIENPEGKEILKQEFNANDPNDIFKGHYLFQANATLDKEGLYLVKTVLLNWQDEPLWDLERKFWTMIEGDGPPDP